MAGEGCTADVFRKDGVITPDAKAGAGTFRALLPVGIALAFMFGFMQVKFVAWYIAKFGSG